MEATTIPHERGLLHTRCGRTIAVSRFAVGTLPAALGRVVLNTACERYDLGEVWASLTPEEARHLAGLLLQQAALAEGASGTDAESAGRVAVAGAGGDMYEVSARGHLVIVDQPAADGGTDTGPTPVELLVGSLASCVAHYAGRYIDRHSVTREGLRATAEYTMATDRPARIAAAEVRLSVPGLAPQRADALLTVARHCTVHNTLAHPPKVTIELEPQSRESPT
jgi:uncharacterized OsmC-like protein